MNLVALMGTGVFALGIAGVAATYASGPVSRQRVERFALRQRLLITEDNGNQVIRYLATTRRWRVAGFVGGFLFSVATPAEGQLVHVEFITLFVGWFLGALIAEVRVAHLAHGTVRAASLQPRRPGSYVSPVAWALVPATAVVAVVVAALAALAAMSGLATPAWTAWAWFAVALAVAAAVRAIQLTVLRRAQPHAAPDVLAGDDAIRSRSLHVLSGGGAALVLLVALNELGAAHPSSDAAQMVIGGVQTLGVFVVAAAGWLVATSIWPRPRPQPRTDGTATVGAL